MNYVVLYDTVDMNFVPYIDSRIIGGKWWRDNHSAYCRKLRRKLRGANKR